MSKVLCFGELLLRLSPVLNGGWIKDASMPVFVGGAELNTATALATWKVPVTYCTALPDHYLSKEIVASIQDRNIETNHILYSGNRIGIYYLPQGADLKAAGAIYDRAYSSFYELQPGQIDWDTVFEGISWFHFSAINPALNANVTSICKEALAAAVKKGITISVDLNYRAKLWQWGKQPYEVMPELVEYCDVVMGNIWAAEKMLGISIPTTLSNNKEAYIEQSLRTSETLVRMFSSCQKVANTFRFDFIEGVKYYATLFEKDQLFIAPEQHTEFFIDKVGSGDTFMAGLIYGNFYQHAPQEIIDFAAAAAFNKLFIKGDSTTASVEEIKKSYLNYV